MEKWNTRYKPHGSPRTRVNVSDSPHAQPELRGHRDHVLCFGVLPKVSEGVRESRRMGETQKGCKSVSTRVGHRYIFERTALEILVEPSGFLVAITFSSTACLLFVTSYLLGIRRASTTDPDMRIVEICEYDFQRIVKDWCGLCRVKQHEPVSSKAIPLKNL